MSSYANPLPFLENNLYDTFFQENPDAALQYYMGQRGIQSQDPYGRFLRSQGSTIYNQYLADLPNRPLEFKYLDYLSDQSNNLQQQFRGLSPQMRGETPRDYSGRVRWAGF